MRGTKRESLVIQPRDRRLLGELVVMRLIDREQAKVAAGFSSTTRVNARLLKLVRAGFLKRDFIGTIPGGRRAIYRLTSEGAALARTTAPESVETSLRTSTYDHQLEINEVYLALKDRRLLPPGTTLKRWRVFTKKLSASAPIIPDSYFELETASGLHPMFLEVDLGTETLSVFEGKVRGYLKLAISGDFQKLSRRERFRVLVVTRGEKRLRNLRKKTLQATSKIFWFAELQALKERGLFSAVWLRPQGEEYLPLL